MLLLIPGPVTTRPAVQAAMAQDIAPWDNEFRAFFSALRNDLPRLAGVTTDTHAALPLQGCGHFITEAAIRTFVPLGQKILVPMTGAYADRMIRLAREAGRVPVTLTVPEGRSVTPDTIASALAQDPSIGHVGLVQSETGSGVVHDPAAIGPVVGAAGRRMIVDAVSAFGALPLNLADRPEIDAAVFTTNKCLEAMPGMGFAIARTDRLQECAGNAGSWSFDLSDIYAHAVPSGGGTSRFTPPAQVLAALGVAIDIYDAEGGQPVRLARYQANARRLYDGMLDLGLTPYLSREMQGPIVLNVHAPADPNWDLMKFVDLLKARGVLISNFYNTPLPSFRVGCIGAITPADMDFAVRAMGQALDRLGITQRKAA
jgi:2-aminoethylphosphonate-pyruvate transaminase